MNFAVIGYPINHSFSPFLHEVNFKENNDPHIYMALEVKPDTLKNIRELVEQYQLTGFNVTIPHKESIIEHLDEVHESASNIGAVNTVLVKNDKLIGYNTDISGYKESFIDSFTDANKKILILGAGGAAKAVMEAHRQMNHEVSIVARNPKSFEKFPTKSFKKLLTSNSYNDTYDVIINATPLGLQNEDAFKVFKLECAIHKDTIGIDLIYNPTITKFMQHFKTSKNGLDMLIYQAIDAYKIWTEKEGSKEAVKAAFIERELTDEFNR